MAGLRGLLALTVAADTALAQGGAGVQVAEVPSALPWWATFDWKIAIYAFSAFLGFFAATKMRDRYDRKAEKRAVARRTQGLAQTMASELRQLKHALAGHG